MPVWHELTKDARKSGELVLLGVIQEQHPDRCRLFAQWKNFEWPILHDPINLLQARAVPMFVAIDAAGIVVDANLKAEELPAFLERPANPEIERVAAERPTARSLDEAAFSSKNAADWIAAGDHHILWGNATDIAAAAQRYSTAVKLDSQSAAAWFRLGVAYRMLFDSANSPPQDFQAAVDAWGRALEIDPNHYIYRRRIQQYGPRLTKPYPFYDWIRQAREEITARGEEPVELTVEPVGAEIAQPANSVEQVVEAAENPDPQARITTDRNQYISVTSIVVPGTIAKGDAVRVHLEFSPTLAAHWNNEAEPMTVWIDVPEGWKTETALLTATQPDEPESRETRRLDFELASPQDTDVEQVQAYALYYVCEDFGGQCLYRRQDISIPIRFRN